MIYTSSWSTLLPSLMYFSQPPRFYQVHSMQLSFNEVSSLLLLGKPPRNSGTDDYARNQLLARNRTSNTQCTTPKVLAPHQRCWRHIKSAILLTGDLKGLMTLLALFLIADSDALLATSVLLPNQLCASLLLWRLQYFLMHIKSASDSDEDFITETDLWLWIALGTPSAPHQRCQHHIKGAPLLTEDLKGLMTHVALLLIAHADALRTTSTPLPGPFSSVFLALPFCCDCHQASLAWAFTL